VSSRNSPQSQPRVPLDPDVVRRFVASLIRAHGRDRLSSCPLDLAQRPQDLRFRATSLRYTGPSSSRSEDHTSRRFLNLSLCLIFGFWVNRLPRSHNRSNLRKLKSSTMAKNYKFVLSAEVSEMLEFRSSLRSHRKILANDMPSNHPQRFPPFDVSSRHASASVAGLSSQKPRLLQSARINLL